MGLVMLNYTAALKKNVLQILIVLVGHAKQLNAAEAITILIGAMVTGIAAISNDNIQDLKVGQLIGATPWKQQLMLLLGVVISALIMPPVMQLLFDVYGISGVMPHPNMDPSHSLPAPTAALLAAITEAMFRHTLPWNMMFSGACLIVLLLILNHQLRLTRFFKLSILGVAIGMYLPLSTSFPLFLGGMLAYFVKCRLKARQLDKETTQKRQQIGTLLACGLVTGSALMDVFVAIPHAMMHRADALALVSPNFEPYAIGLSLLVLLGLCYWIMQRVVWQ